MAADDQSNEPVSDALITWALTRFSAHPPTPREQSYEAVLAWLRVNTGLTESSETAALQASKQRREPLPLSLNRLGMIGDKDLQAAFAAISGLPCAGREEVETANLGELRPNFLRRHRALPLKSANEIVRLGLVDPFDDEAVRGVRFALRRDVEIVILKSGDQRRLFAQAFEQTSDPAGNSDWSGALAEAGDSRLLAAIEFDRDAPVARKVAAWLTAAVERRASDVHIEPRAHALLVRYRIDGRLEAAAEEPLAAAASVIARIKVLADLDLGERRAAQDGRTTIVIAGRPIDVRVSIVPSVNGESAVLRILDRAEVRLTFQDLGFADAERALLTRAVTWPHGLFLVTGPTGSGKTTTLYAMLEAMRNSERKILTIEDPVEFHFEHVTQVQYAPKAGVTFPSAIRAFLRQDPDVILVGEIRDSDTAKAAVQAALTGHLVLATLHAIDAERAVPRLLDMGVEPFQLGACFKGALSQRLVRRLCDQCRRPHRATPAEIEALEASAAAALAGAILYDAAGCSQCNATGFSGRIAIAEGFEATPAILDVIRMSGQLADELPAVMASQMAADGARKCASGETTILDVRRALSG